MVTTIILLSIAIFLLIIINTSKSLEVSRLNFENEFLKGEVLDLTGKMSKTVEEIEKDLPEPKKRRYNKKTS